MSDSRRHKTVIPASGTVRGGRRVTDRRSRLLSSSALSGGTLRGLALAAGVSIAATVLWAAPARAQQSLNGGTATGTNAYASGSVAFAGQTDDALARLDALEKENAAIRKENAALRENKLLRQRNATLKASDPESRSSATAPAPAVAGPK